MSNPFEDYVDRVPSVEEYEEAQAAASWHHAYAVSETARANRAEEKLERARSKVRLLLALLAIMISMWVCAGLLAGLAG